MRIIVRLVAVWGCFLVATTASAQQTPKPTVRLGILLDGPSELNAGWLQIYRQEIDAVLKEEYDVVASPDKTLVADWTGAGVRARLERLLSDDSVDVILTLGLLSSFEAGRRSILPKAVFAPYIIHPDLERIPYRQQDQSDLPVEDRTKVRVSGVDNLNYVTLGAVASRDVTRFLEVTQFQRLAVLVLPAWTQLSVDLGLRVDEALASLGLERIDLIQAGASVADTLAAIPADIEAVYVTPLTSFSPSQFSELAAGLRQRKLPSFSMMGRDEVAEGLLAGVGPSQDTQRRARRVALHLYRVLKGESAANLPIDYTRQERLSINMATARSIGVSPRYVVLLEADQLEVEEEQVARSLSLGAVVRAASVANLDLAAADRRVAAGEATVREARAGLLPQISIGGSASIIDERQVRGPDIGGQQLSLITRQEFKGTLRGSQLIYSDRVWASYGVEKSLQELRTEERAELRLDTILQASEAYLNLLRAKSIERIQRNNLALTRRNLDLARSRVEIGVAGREEVLRWESQVADNQRALLDARAFRAQGEYEVNRVLNRPIRERFQTAEAGLNDPELTTSFDEISPYVDSPGGFAIFGDFMVGRGFDQSPELRQLDAAIRAQQRELTSARREYFLPDVSLSGSFGTVHNNGQGVNLFNTALNGRALWEVRLDAELPLFRGGGRYARNDKAREQLQQLSFEQAATRQRVEQRVRFALQDANAAFIGIELANTAAEAGRQNLDLVTDSYSQGVVGILVLLDAQDQALSAELSAANAVFEYLIQLMGVQRAIGQFDYFRSPQDRQDFVNTLDAYFREIGYPVRRP